MKYSQKERDTVRIRTAQSFIDWFKIRGWGLGQRKNKYYIWRSDGQKITELVFGEMWQAQAYVESTL
jgi:hypothetical protein